jgi:lauroyl/myristoyl acyltransferase
VSTISAVVATAVPELRTRIAETARRSVPTALVPWVVRARTRRALGNPLIRHQARLQMEFLLAKTRPEADLDDAARRYIEHEAWRSERRWHPEMLQQRIEGADRLRELAAGSPRGVVVTFMHHGADGGAALASWGLRFTIVAHRNWFLPDTPRWMRQALRVTTVGQDVISVAEGSTGIKERLAAGATVALALDVPGQTEVNFVGRRVMGTSGAARIATEMDVPVVLWTSHRDGDGTRYMRMSEPVEPRDFGSAEELLAELIRRHEESVLDWPEALQWSSRRWTLLDDEDKERFVPGAPEWLI